MRIKMLTTRVGAKSFYAGKEYDLPDARAVRWVANGWALTVGAVASDAIETTEFAVADTVAEVTVSKHRRRKVTATERNGNAH